MDINIAKAIALVVFMTVTLTCGLLPIWLVKRGILTTSGSSRRTVVLDFLNCFAGGVFLGTCLLYLLTQGREEFDKYKTDVKMSSTFPFYETLMALGLFLVALMERLGFVLMSFSRKSHSLRSDKVPAVNSSHNVPLLGDHSRNGPDIKTTYGSCLTRTSGTADGTFIASDKEPRVHDCIPNDTNSMHSCENTRSDEATTCYITVDRVTKDPATFYTSCITPNPASLHSHNQQHCTHENFDKRHQNTKYSLSNQYSNHEWSHQDNPHRIQNTSYETSLCGQSGEESQRLLNCRQHHSHDPNVSITPPPDLTAVSFHPAPSFVSHSSTSVTSSVEVKVSRNVPFLSGDVVEHHRHHRHSTHRLHHHHHQSLIVSTSCDAGSISEASWVRVLLLLMALSFHTLFDGLAVGLQDSVDSIWQVMAAITTHKVLVAFCIGLELSAISGSSRCRPVVYLVLFSLMSPIGIAVGMGVNSGYLDELAKLLTSSILQALATGTFLYVTFFEILGQQFAHNHDREQRHCRELLKVAMTFIGFAAMAGMKNLDKN